MRSPGVGKHSPGDQAPWGTGSAAGEAGAAHHHSTRKRKEGVMQKEEQRSVHRRAQRALSRRWDIPMKWCPSCLGLERGPEALRGRTAACITQTSKCAAGPSRDLPAR